MASDPAYRDADYDIDPYIQSTASWPDGLHEAYRFLPNYTPKVRRTTSADDISRYNRYYCLARTNRGKWFTWKHYLQILKEDLSHFDTIVVMSKILLNRLATPVNSELSNYVTASESDSCKITPRSRSKWKKKAFPRKEIGGDAESISSMDDFSINSNISLTPQTNLLKKMCTEIRSLARKTCKTVEKISTKTKYCSSCGDYIGSVKAHKKCSQAFGDITDHMKPLTQSTVNVSELIKTHSMAFESPIRTPISDFGYRSGSHPSPSTLAPHAACRVKSFINQAH